MIYKNLKKETYFTTFNTTDGTTVKNNRQTFNRIKSDIDLQKYYNFAACYYKILKSNSNFKLQKNELYSIEEE